MDVKIINASKEGSVEMDRENLKLLIKESARVRNLGLIIFENTHHKKHHHLKHSSKLHHTFKTKHGHHIDVYVKYGDKGNGMAKLYNRDLSGVVKKMYWPNEHSHPSKKEMEDSLSYTDSRSLFENTISLFLFERESKLESNYDKLEGDPAGKIAEHSTMIELTNHVHNINGTTGSKEHLEQINNHQREIEKITKGKNYSPQQISTKIHHGKVAAEAIIADVDDRFKGKARIARVGHTAKNGDIPKFTQNKHKDTQDNPSDVALELDHEKPSSKKPKYWGYSLKSQQSGTTLTARNPAIHLNGHLDIPGHNFSQNITKIAKHRRKKVIDALITKFGRSMDGSDADRKKTIDSFREQNPHVKKSQSPYELEANKISSEQGTLEHMAKQLSNHINRPMQEHHHKVGKMLSSYLTNPTDMPWSKISVRGTKAEKSVAEIKEGSINPLKNILEHPNTRFYAEHNGRSVRIHAIHKDENGEEKHIHVATISSKPKSNISATSISWKVDPAVGSGI